MPTPLTRTRTLLALALVAGLAWLALRGLPDGRLHVWFLDVGQGDAILIQAPDGRQILVDGGPSPAALGDELGAVLPFWDRSLDLLVLTHPDADHLTGFLPLFERYRIGGVVHNVDPADPAAAAWLDLLARHAIAPGRAVRGARLQVGAVTLTVLNPGDGAGVAAGGNDNDRSVVLRVDHGPASVLLTGDAGEAAEQAMIAAGLPLDVDILKVAHHGSAGGTSARFLAHVTPELAVISVGTDNRFGHPAGELLDRLAGVTVLRTDERGRIEAVADGDRWRVKTER